ncbi:MAG TPA: hypothetical protein VFZ93_07385 [Albitalea sp.]
MKAYRLTGWPELGLPYHRTAYRRMLSDMSQRYVTVPQLAEASGLKRHVVREFIAALETRGVVEAREEGATPDARSWSLRPLGGWLRRAIASSTSAQR